MQNSKYFQTKSTGVFILICFFIAACASNRDNIQSVWSHQQDSNTYASHEQKIKITFPNYKWQLYSEQKASPEVIRNIWKKPQYDGDSYNVAIALNPEDDVFIMHLKIIPSNNPAFNYPFENMMIQMANAYKFTIESAGGQVENFKTRIIKRENKEIAIGELIYREQRNFGAFLGLLKEKDRLVLFEFYILEEHLEARESEFLEIIDSYERFDKLRQYQLSSNAKQKTDLETARSYLNRGKAFAQHQGQYDQALLAFNTAIEIDPDYAEAYIRRGHLFQLYGQSDPAISDYSKAIEIKPDFADAYVSRGIAYSKDGRYAQGLGDFNKAIELGMQSAVVYSSRGNAYQLSGQYDQAISDYNKALKMSPQDFGIYKNRGQAFLVKSKYDQAIRDFNKAIEINPDFADAYLDRGNAYYYQKQYEQSITDYDKTIELQPEAAMAYNNRGAAYAKSGKYDQSIADYNHALSIDPGSAFISANVAWFLATCPDKKFRDGHKAIEIAQKEATKSSHPESLASLAAGYAETGKFNEAIATQTKVIALLKQQDKAENLDKYLEVLSAYKNHKPWREKLDVR